MAVFFQKHPLKTLLLLTTGALYFHFFMEWLFFITKPSMLNVLTIPEQWTTLLIAPLPELFISYLLVCVIIFPAYHLLLCRLSPATMNRLLLLVPAWLLASSILLLIENFTYTLFQFGMYRFTGYGRIVYTLLFLYLWYRCCLALDYHFPSLPDNKDRYPLPYAAVPLLLFVSIALAATHTSAPPDSALAIRDQPANSHKPNILVLSSDGINARNMSIYGYHRQTTPFLDSIKPELLVFENHLTNSQTTTGSIAAFHSGKLPTTTRLIYRPDLFRGHDAYQHLPGILMKLGYKNGDFSVRHYVDPEDINLKEGFHYANYRSIADNRFTLPKAIERAYPNASRFHDELIERVRSRLSHLFWQSTLSNPFLIVTEPDNHWKWDLNDRGRIDDLKQFIKGSPQPFYAHAHLLGTHGSMFNLSTRLFSKGQQQSKPWMIDFYDDAILEYDQYAAEIVNFLKTENLFEKTLIIFTSDHGMAWRINETIPLLIRFPDSKYVGTRQVNSQHTDLTATILDYLNLDIPAWMEGQSLLSIHTHHPEPIFAVQKSQSLPNEKGWHRVVAPKPPFYTLGSINVTFCNRLYRLKLPGKKVTHEPVKGHTRPCPESELPSDQQAYRILIRHLQKTGYDTQSLEPPSS